MAAQAGLGQGEAILEPLDGGEQSLNMTRFKKPEEGQKRRCMRKEHLQECIVRQGGMASD